MCALCCSGPFRCVGWFWRSVCSPSPPALFWPFARRWCPLFSSSCLSGLTRPWPGVCVCVCVCNIWIDVKLLFFLFSPSSRGTQHFTGTVSNEATSEMGYPAWPAGRTCNAIISILLTWQGAKQRTPTNTNLVLHGCRNLRFSSASFSTLFAWYSYCHGEGLSREPYRDYCQCLRFIWWCLWSRWSSRSTSLWSANTSRIIVFLTNLQV